jgi:hypothetical protein
VVYRDVTRQAKGLYRLKHVGALGSGLAYLSRYNSGWFCHKRRRRRLRPHRGQLTPSISTPPRLPSQHHIITPELYDHLVESLVPCIILPTLTGVCPRRRHPCLRRLPLIQPVYSRLIAPTPSPRLTEAHAQVPCRR